MINKTRVQNIYFIGIKGVGMTMLAQFLKSQGHIVSGSDNKESFMTDRVLRSAKIKVFSPFDPANLPISPDMIIYSSAYTPDNNPELEFIMTNSRRFKKVPLLSYAAALGGLFNRYEGVAVCGSHGKTTVSAWLGYVLWRAGQEPNVLVGSRVPQLKGSGLSGRSKNLIAEVDEYQNKLQFFSPRGVVLNNIDYDHPDFFPTPGSYVRVFREFIKKIPADGWLVVNRDDHEALKQSRACLGRVIGYSLQKPARKSGRASAGYVASDLKQQGEKQTFKLEVDGKNSGIFSIKLPGRHNVSNSLGVIAACRQLKVGWDDIRRHLASFTGTERRAQIGEYRGAHVMDDYAHHPAEIKATLEGLRSRYPEDNMIVVFHPHTFSRTEALFKDFVTSFKLADRLIILDIYGSARERSGRGQGTALSQRLAQAIRRDNRSKKKKQAVTAISTLNQAAELLRKTLTRGDRLILMGAGDVFRIGRELLK